MTNANLKELGYCEFWGSEMDVFENRKNKAKQFRLLAKVEKS